MRGVFWRCLGGRINRVWELLRCRVNWRVIRNYLFTRLYLRNVRRSLGTNRILNQITVELDCLPFSLCVEKSSSQKEYVTRLGCLGIDCGHTTSSFCPSISCLCFRLSSAVWSEGLARLGGLKSTFSSHTPGLSWSKIKTSTFPYLFIVS